MILRVISTILVPLNLVLFATGCAHTPPGTSVEIALAKKADLIRLPAPPATAVVAASGGYPVVEPPLPKEDKTALVADAYSRGQFCLQAGKDEEAITAFREVVTIDPNFADGWTNLAMLYEKSGQGKEAVDAFRKAKTIAQH